MTTAGVRPYRILAVEGIDGSGKSTLVSRITNKSSLNSRSERLSPCMGGIYRDLVDVPSQSKTRYQDVIPGDLRYGSFIIDAIAQFHYRSQEYAQYDWLVFDRWMPTYDVYCEGKSVYDEWYQRVARCLPEPDLLVRLRATPRVAAERVTARGDWTADNWSAERLLADLTRLDERYDRALKDVPHHVVDADRDADAVYGDVLDLIRGVR
ncbi:hypothetical protein [Streptomyces odontomachi]|uniref:hypothetical protein n=1 Tax=Streptomyces odontomachi TaxID=2944940 RepID=UPI00210E642E|nr:hypothetical protein [Streptomyces sp. ODS25]